MVAKPVTVGVVGVIVLASALALNYFVLPGEESEPVTTASAPSAPVPAPTAQPDRSRTPGASTPSRADPSGDTGVPPERREPPSTPSFDVVRVDPDGNTVIAGRGAPNTEIAIVDGDREIGRATTDDRGEWVFVPESKLEPGQRVLTLRELDDDPAESDEAVVLVIPKKGKDISGRASDEPSVPLAVVVPKDRGDDSGRTVARVLQAPAAGALNSGDTGGGGDRAGGGGGEARSADAASPPAATSVPPADSSEPAVAALAPEPGPAPASTPSTQPPAPGDDPAPVVSAYPDAGSGDPAVAGAGEEAVAVDVIDYDDKGDVVFSGRAEPGARVEVFIDNRKVGDTGADAEGRWTMRPQDPVAPGSYQLRVDKVAPGGVVEARIAFPFVRADPLTDLPNNRLVVIQPGNNLWRISTRVYGSGVRYVEIFDANKDQILDPDLIYPGQVFGLPRVN